MMTKACVALLVTLLGVAEACTYFELPYGKDGEFMIGRTMELGGEWLEEKWTVQAMPQKSKFAKEVIPHLPLEEAVGEAREELQTRALRDDKRHFVGKYGFLAIYGGFGKIGGHWEVGTEGMNEKGLAASMHTHMKAQYQQGTPAAQAAKDVIQFIQFVPYVLSQFATTEEMVEKFESGDVAFTSHGFIPSFLSTHFSIVDANQHSVVVEFVQGEMKIHLNQVGVFTNDPEFDWHLRNLNQFAAISPNHADRSGDIGTVRTEVGPVPTALNHGFNLLGLPGNFGPPARFVRTFFLKNFAIYNDPPKDETAAVRLTTAIVNHLAIPMGVAAKTNMLDIGDFTQWAVIKMPSSGKMMFRNYVNNAWQAVDMNALLPFLQGSKPGTKPKIIKVFGDDDGIKDVTASFNI
ncbi:Conjugated bile acid hydrolase (CBAH) (Bile salt hydrolase) (BSH) (CBAH-1) (Choloylglycine hydrolase) [Durusdinium trenchii]|uniref:Conjugated bile acid hydrolase (CBAH) (Bile salt hydrolase) (BSH) (CBAH-1) (Choloylglycine hydrolase) n=1 Tax=Durusdinium trenchii TaxID=1381693 RepID=A0ABP0HKA4_9DINO